MRSVCVFLGSSAGNHPAYMEATAALGREMARRGLTCVYGGSRTGLMNRLAESVLAAGGEIVGVTVQALKDREEFHTGLTRLHVMPTMHERKTLMIELSDAFIALPGGLGTLEELCEILTWAQLGFHRKPCGLLDVAGYYTRLNAFLDTAVDEGFVMGPHRGMLLSAQAPGALLDRFADYTPPTVNKWIERAQGL